MHIVTSASKDKDARTLACDKDFGATVADSVKLFGEEVCKNKLDAQLKVDLQGMKRRLMKAGKTDKEILEAVAAWVPSLKKAGKSPEEKMDSLWAKLSPEEQKAQLKKWAAGKK